MILKTSQDSIPLPLYHEFYCNYVTLCVHTLHTYLPKPTYLPNLHLPTSTYLPTYMHACIHASMRMHTRNNHGDLGTPHGFRTSLTPKIINQFCLVPAYVNVMCMYYRFYRYLCPSQFAFDGEKEWCDLDNQVLHLTSLKPPSFLCSKRTPRDKLKNWEVCKVLSSRHFLTFHVVKDSGVLSILLVYFDTLGFCGRYESPLLCQQLVQLGLLDPARNCCAHHKT